MKHWFKTVPILNLVSVIAAISVVVLASIDKHWSVVTWATTACIWMLIATRWEVRHKELVDSLRRIATMQKQGQDNK